MSGADVEAFQETVSGRVLEKGTLDVHVRNIEDARRGKPSMVMLREAPIDSTSFARTFLGGVLGCCSAAPGAPFSVSPSKPLMVTYSVQVPCTNTVSESCLFSLDKTLFNDWPALQFTTTAGMSCADMGGTSKVPKNNAPRSPIRLAASFCGFFTMSSFFYVLFWIDHCCLVLNAFLALSFASRTLAHLASSWLRLTKANFCFATSKPV